MTDQWTKFARAELLMAVSQQAFLNYKETGGKTKYTRMFNVAVEALEKAYELLKEEHKP